MVNGHIILPNSSLHHLRIPLPGNSLCFSQERQLQGFTFDRCCQEQQKTDEKGKTENDKLDVSEEGMFLGLDVCKYVWYSVTKDSKYFLWLASLEFRNISRKQDGSFHQCFDEVTLSKLLGPHRDQMNVRCLQGDNYIYYLLITGWSTKMLMERPGVFNFFKL